MVAVHVMRDLFDLYFHRHKECILSVGFICLFAKIYRNPLFRQSHLPMKCRMFLRELLQENKTSKMQKSIES